MGNVRADTGAPCSWLSRVFSTKSVDREKDSDRVDISMDEGRSDMTALVYIEDH